MGVTQHSFRVAASVPDEMVSLDCGDEWAAWSGVDCGTADGRETVVLVSITVAPFGLAPGATAGAVLKKTLRARHPAGSGVIEEFTADDGNPAVLVRCAVTQQLNGRPVTTGQAQALVVFPSAGALGVVSALCPDPADLERAAALVAAIAVRMTVTAATAAA